MAPLPGRYSAQSASGRYTRLPAAANSFDFWAMPSSISS
ncbi:putative Phosphomethylpyrimidine synthase [Streptomyces viridochromogenes Tue57]|uniref:Putative Phosphomethylpyrimidine synthase n=1 Tax=Streptomyces viridochromogenes Tue57 TaxID=1160705 RepID=L8PDZ4_STRVR|nr:putative Phosphomethylpyrimidine synthase [Streptomyces viridochromogenes Tue57]